jgi:hypothetical protein
MSQYDRDRLAVLKGIAESIRPLRAAASRTDHPGPDPRTRREDRALLIVRMSSGRLVLDQVGRHQSPSPLHRRDQLNTHFSGRRGKGTFLLCGEGDVSILR